MDVKGATIRWKWRNPTGWEVPYLVHSIGVVAAVGVNRFVAVVAGPCHATAGGCGSGGKASRATEDVLDFQAAVSRMYYLFLATPAM